MKNSHSYLSYLLYSQWWPIVSFLFVGKVAKLLINTSNNPCPWLKIPSIFVLCSMKIKVPSMICSNFQLILFLWCVSNDIILNTVYFLYFSSKRKVSQTASLKKYVRQLQENSWILMEKVSSITIYWVEQTYCTMYFTDL